MVEARVEAPTYESHEIEPAAPEAEYPDLLPGETPQNLAVAVDPERRQISLRMSYTVAIVAGFAVVVIVALWGELSAFLPAPLWTAMAATSVAANSPPKLAR